MREHRVKHKDLPEAQRIKANARAYVKEYIRRGYIQKLPCEKCGSIFSECHHEDYTKPLEVKFLCRSCHLKLHQQEKRRLKKVSKLTPVLELA